MFELSPRFSVRQAEVQLSGRRPVRWSRFVLDRAVEPHDHEFTEIVLIHAGEAQHATRDGRRKLSAGDVVVVPPGRVHAFSAVRRLELTNIYFLPEWFLPELALNETDHGILPLFFSASIFRPEELHLVHEFSIGLIMLKKVVRELVEIEVGTRDDWSARWITCCFLKVLLLLATAYHRSSGGIRPRQLAPKIWSALAEVDRSALAGERLDLERLADSLGYTRDHLTRIFRAATGQGPNDFYQARRLQFVCRALLETASTVSEVSHRFGYADEAHLCRLFRMRLKLTPSEYRRKFHK